MLKKYEDKRNHNRSTLVFTNSREITINSKVFDELELTDSIIKITGELLLTVYRGDNRFTIKLD